MQTQGDDFDRRSRLISLVYEVLRTMETPAEGANETATCAALSRAFSEKAIALANLDAAALKTGPKPPRPKQRT
jgi:hypothetical protein